MPLSIKVHSSDAPGQPVTGALLTIGRVAGNHLVLSDNRISSRHGRLVRSGEGYAYEDLGSRNGSLIERRGRRMGAPAHQPVPVISGDRLLLGDLADPVVLVLEGGLQTEEAHSGGTVVARREVGLATLDGSGDPQALKALFKLLQDLGSETDPEIVFKQVAAAIINRFPQADSANLLQPEAGGDWVAVQSSQQGDSAPTPPSTTLLRKAIAGKEIVSYLPGMDAAPASMIGLAGAVLTPLIAGDEAIGVLHVASKRGPFGAQDLGWFSIVGMHLAATLVTARRFRALTDENQSLRSAVNMPRPIVGRSVSLKRALRQIERVARTDANVLIWGETGTGKELAARYVHACSQRSQAVFAPVNCAALSENLLSSELFGHKKGAFTGATRDHKGLFENADGGTIFLDEIGEISHAVQVRLLRVLQEKEVQPVGSSKPIKVDARIVAATNRDLAAEVKAGRFREDLYYRLAVFPVDLPALRDREGDIELLAERFREAACARHDKWVGGFTMSALNLLRRHAWPGNIRQLEHEIERAVILADDGALIGDDELSARITGAEAPRAEAALPVGQLREVMAELEERVIRRCLEETGGNRTKAASALGISRQALQTKLAKWRLRDDG